MRLSSPIPIPLPDNADYALVLPSESQTFTEPFHSWPYVPYHMYKGLSLRFLDYIIYHHFLPESRRQSLCQVIVWLLFTGSCERNRICPFKIACGDGGTGSWLISGVISHDVDSNIVGTFSLFFDVWLLLLFLTILRMIFPSKGFHFMSKRLPPIRTSHHVRHPYPSDIILTLWNCRIWDSPRLHSLSFNILTKSSHIWFCEHTSPLC